MTKEEVLLAREYFRISRTRTVYDKKTKEPMVVDDLYPIAIELDNSEAFSEATHVVAWDDDHEMIIGIGNNKNEVHGGNPAMGHDKPLNAAVATIACYDMIQQLRIELDIHGYQELMKKIIAKKAKVAYNGKEVTATEVITKNGQDFIFRKVDPQYYLKEDSRLQYTTRPENFEIRDSEV